MAYETILTCAMLAQHVYSNLPTIGDWERKAMVDDQQEGFYGAGFFNTHDKDGVIVAVRGTNSQQDGIDDLSMVPGISGNKADHAMRKLIVEYCKGSPAHAVIQHANDAAGITSLIFDVKGSSRMKDWGNRIPEAQAKHACSLAQRVYRFCQENNVKIKCFTGHSLGGALAQYLSEQTGGGATQIPEKIPAVAFNSPNMGTIAGMRKGNGGGILCVNSRLDPLSLATQLAGNESHAKNEDYYILVNTLAATPAPKVSNPLTYQERANFFKWLGDAALCYHGMSNLYTALCTKYPGSKLLSSFFPKQ